MTTRRAWTLVETLVSLAVLAVLMSIAIPTLRTVIARSQTTKNMANMGLTMKDFFTWSSQNHDVMVNKGLPPEGEVYGYLSQSTTWPNVLYEAFGEASPHWHSTYHDPAARLARMGGTMSLAEARRIDPDWEWRLPSLFAYSNTFHTRSDTWRFPGLNLPDQEAYSAYYALVRHAEVRFPAQKGVLLHQIGEPGPGDQRLAAFADGSVSQRDREQAVPAASPPIGDPERRGGPVMSTENGFLGLDWNAH